MNQRHLSLALFVVLLIVAVVWALPYRLRIEAALWHYRHGSQIAVGSYVVTVPKNWHVKEFEGGSQLLSRLDTENHEPYMRTEAHAGIVIFPQRPIGETDIDRVIALETDALAKRGPAPVSKRMTTLAGEPVPCYGGIRTEVPAPYDMHSVWWDCMFPGGLHLIITSTDPDLNQIWDIVSHIRKKIE